MAVRPILWSVSLFSTSLIVSWFIFEIICRVFVDNGMHYHLEMWKYSLRLKEVSPYAAIGHEHIANGDEVLMGVRVRTNSDGLRENGRAVANSESVRVLMLGDSITFGWGVDERNTVSAQLEEHFEKSLGPKVKVLNSGVGNYNTAMEVAWFTKYGLAMLPDIVVLNIFINDAEPTPIYSKINWWDRYLYSRVIFFGALDTVSRRLLGGSDWRSYYDSLYEEDSAGWLKMKNSIAKLADLCDEKGIKLIFVNYPELRQLNPYPFRHINTKLSALASQNKVPYIDLLNSVDMYNPETLWVSIPDPHPNSLATSVFANALNIKLMREFPEVF
ncbi:MAG: hypothetical protein CMM25_00345 [Rhodospirillaceae bacterium]|nr:hypothetical protein [Rhodospirillaceae bacterium]